VIIPSLAIHGAIRSIFKNKATVGTNDGLSFEVKLNQLERSHKPLIEKTRNRLRTYEPSSSSISTTLNLIGERVEAALERVVPFLDTAYGSGIKRVKIIHGFGTGQLKKALRDFLRKSHYVDHIEEALANDGGGGATIVILK